MDVCNEAWSKFFRPMRKTNVACYLDAIGVFSVEDAKTMVRSVSRAVRSTTSSRTAVMFGKIAVPDVSLQACETSCLLDVVLRKMTSPPRSRGTRARRKAAVEWMLRRLPAKRSALRQMRKTLRAQAVRKHQESGFHKDTQSAAHVIQAWLENDPQEVTNSMWGLLSRSRGSRAAPFSMIAVLCVQRGSPVDSSNYRTRRSLRRDCSESGCQVAQRKRMRSPRV